MRVLTERLALLIAAAGYGGGEPVIAGVHGQGCPPVFAAQGVAVAGKPVGADTLAYAASLSKQITAGCAALLVRESALDMEETLARWLPGLPAWAGTVRLRHLLHHTAALPDAQVDAIAGGTADRTTAAVLSALAQVPALAGRPGAAYDYSGAGYVCLAAAVERAAGQPLPEFTAQRIFIPLGMYSTCYWPGPAPAPPGAAPLASAHPAPLSLGDGGVWSTARDLLRWSQALNADDWNCRPFPVQVKEEGDQAGHMHALAGRVVCTHLNWRGVRPAPASPMFLSQCSRLERGTASFDETSSAGWQRRRASVKPTHSNRSCSTPSTTTSVPHETSRANTLEASFLAGCRTAGFR